MSGGAKLQPQSHDSWCDSWKESLVQVGQDIRVLRETQGITLQAIHVVTKVPTYHLRALEAGDIERLPDAIFVRGFLKKICQFLGPEGEALLAKLPETQPSPMMSPVTQAHRSGQSPGQGCSLNVSHLYLSYGILLAGAMGGLAWTDQMSQLGHDDLRGTVEQSSEEQSPKPMPIASLLNRAVSASRSIAPPSLQGPELSL